jgi:hypothetical protein
MLPSTAHQRRIIAGPHEQASDAQTSRVSPRNWRQRRVGARPGPICVRTKSATVVQDSTGLLAPSGGDRDLRGLAHRVAMDTYKRYGVKRLAIALALACCGKSERPRQQPPSIESAAQVDSVTSPVEEDLGVRGWDRFERVARDAGLELVTASTKQDRIEHRHCTQSNFDDLGMLHLGSCYNCELAYPVDLSDDAHMGLARAIVETPRGMLEAAKAKRIVLCKNFVHKANADVVGGTIDRKTGSVILSFDSRDFRLTKDIFAHELFHLFDLEHEGNDRDDLEWSGLNDNAFHYGDLSTLHPGFFRTYGQKNTREDKATLYAMLMSDPSWLCDYHRNDAILAAKVRLLHARLAKALGAQSVEYIQRLSTCFATP